MSVMEDNGQEPDETGAEGAAQASAADEPAADVAAEDEIAALRQERDKYRDLALRSQAELENTRRRHQRDLENAHRYASEQLIGELLPVVDSLEQTLSSGAAENAVETLPQLLEGTRITLDLLIKALQHSGVVEVPAYREPFNPDTHLAMTMVEDADVPDNHVAEVLQKGYSLHDRIVRPAMVTVARQGSAKGEGEGGDKAASAD